MLVVELILLLWLAKCVRVWVGSVACVDIWPLFEELESFVEWSSNVSNYFHFSPAGRTIIIVMRNS